MNFSIHTKEADNGLILDVDVKGLRLSKKFKPCHEVYTNWGDVRQRMEELTRGFSDRLREMIPEKPFTKEELERASKSLGVVGL